IGDEMIAAAPLLQAFGHRDPDFAIAAGPGIASHVPENCVVLIALAEELAEGESVLDVEHPLRMLVDVPRLGDDQSHDEAQFVGPMDDMVDILEKGLVRFGGIAVNERRLAEQRSWSIRMTRAESAQDVRLDYGESLADAVLQVFLDFVFVETLKQ